jgi:hypothetical protein
LVGKLERLLQTIYTYFSISLKRHHIEHDILAKLLETKGLKLFHNLKTVLMLTNGNLPSDGKIIKRYI